MSGSGRCDISDRVRLALRTMNSNTVPKVVDCVVNQGSCDSTGNWVRNHARYSIDIDMTLIGHSDTGKQCVGEDVAAIVPALRFRSDLLSGR